MLKRAKKTPILVKILIFSCLMTIRITLILQDILIFSFLNWPSIIETLVIMSRSSCCFPFPRNVRSSALVEVMNIHSRNQKFFLSFVFPHFDAFVSSFLTVLPHQPVSGLQL